MSFHHNKKIMIIFLKIKKGMEHMINERLVQYLLTVEEEPEYHICREEALHFPARFKPHAPGSGEESWHAAVCAGPGGICIRLRRERFT